MTKTKPARAPRNFVGKKPFLHPKIANAIDEAMLAIRRPNIPVVMIVGPTGVGKTFIREQLTGMICAAHKPTSKYRPAVGFNVQKFADQRTHWGALNLDLLTALGANKKSDKTHLARPMIAENITLRRNKVIFLDEAQHLVPKQTQKTDPADNADVIKSLVQHIPTKLALLGTYELNPLTRTNDQMARRVKRIHVSRYRSDRPGEMATFRELLAWIDDESHASLDISLAGQADAMYSGCVGLMGVLCDWLGDALFVSQELGSPKITQRGLLKTRKDAKDLKTIDDKAREGEKYFDDIQDEDETDVDGGAPVGGGR